MADSMTRPEPWPEPLRWSIGDVSITAVPELDHLADAGYMFPASTRQELAAIDWLSPHYVDADHRLRLRIQAFLIRTPELRVVVDTCFGNDKPRPRAGNMLDTDLIARLAACGFAPEEVDIVLCTHLHLDHVGWNTRLEDGRWVPTFPNARYLFAREEYAHWDSVTDPHDIAMMEDSVRPVVEAGLVDLVEMDHRVCARIRLLPTPGHTAGHVSVLIASGGREALITGDFLHHPAQMPNPHWHAFIDWDSARSTATRRQMLARLAADGTLMIGTHFAPPTAGYVVPAATGFRLDPTPPERA